MRGTTRRAKNGLVDRGQLATAASSTCRTQFQDHDATSTLRISEGNTSTFPRFSRNWRLRPKLSDDNAKRHTGIKNSVWELTTGISENQRLLCLNQFKLMRRTPPESEHTAFPITATGGPTRSCSDALQHRMDLATSSYESGHTVGMSPPPPPAMPVDLASHTEGRTRREACPSPEAREPDMAQGPFLGSAPTLLHQVFGRIAHRSSVYPELDVQGANFFRCM